MSSTASRSIGTLAQAGGRLVSISVEVISS